MTRTKHHFSTRPSSTEMYSPPKYAGYGNYGTSCHRSSDGLPKIKYPSEAEAARNVRHDRCDLLSHYQCDMCGMWHIGRTPQSATDAPTTIGVAGGREDATP